MGRVAHVSRAFPFNVSFFENHSACTSCGVALISPPRLSKELCINLLNSSVIFIQNGQIFLKKTIILNTPFFEIQPGINLQHYFFNKTSQKFIYKNMIIKDLHFWTSRWRPVQLIHLKFLKNCYLASPGILLNTTATPQRTTNFSHSGANSAFL